MFFETILLAVSLIASNPSWRNFPDLARFAAPTFTPSERAVSNWRREAAFNLDLDNERQVAVFMGRHIKGLSRCVRLNNYWCVKKAGWQGEIASDAEGHVAFASAQEGAAVAAVLLRRYYTVYNLHSARAIVQRWAPAQCGGLGASPMIGARKTGQTRRALGSAPREMRGLTTRGLGNTLRARFLASRGHGRIRTTFAGANSGKSHTRKAAALPRSTLSASVIRERAMPMIKTPTIATGFGEAESAPVRLSMLRLPGMTMGPTPGALSGFSALPPLSSCANDVQRIANYAAKIATGVADGPDADLALFDAAGQPTPNLARALFNMSAVEIGPLGAKHALVEAAIALGLPPPKQGKTGDRPNSEAPAEAARPPSKP